MIIKTNSAFDASLTHELVLDVVLVDKQHEVFEALALAELCFENLIQLLVGFPI